jgi:hypothetical protein
MNEQVSRFPFLLKISLGFCEWDLSGVSGMQDGEISSSKVGQ